MKRSNKTSIAHGQNNPLKIESLEPRAMLATMVPGWTIELGNATDTRPADIVVGEDDHVFVTGNFEGTVDFDPGSGVYNLTATPGHATGDGYVAKYTQDKQLVWAQRLGGAGFESVKSVDLDDDGNVYIGGQFDSVSADFGSFTIGTNGAKDAFMAKLDSSGNFLWANNWGSAQDDQLGEIKVSSDGSTIVAGGHFHDTVDFDPGTGVSLVTSEGLLDGYVATFDTDGTFNWVWTHGGTGDDGFAYVDFDNSGNVYAASRFSQTNDLGQGIVLTAAGDRDKFLAKIDSSGTTVWARQFSSVENLWGQDVVTDKDGHVYVSVKFRDQVDLGPGAPTLNGSQDGLINDYAILKLDTNNNFQWVKQFAATGDYFQITDIETDPSGNPLIAGGFRGTVDLDPGSVAHVFSATASSIDGFVLSIDAADGGTHWAHHYSGAGEVQAHGIAMDSLGRVFVNGEYHDDLQSPTGEVLNTTLNSSFLSRLDVNSTIAFEDSFENGQWNGLWVEDNQNDWETNVGQATDGSYSAQVNGRASDATLSTSSAMDLSNVGSAQLRFDWFINNNFDNGEYLKLDFWNGSNWIEVRSLDGNVDQENVWHNKIIEVDQQFLNSDFQFRYRAKANRSNEIGNVDNVVLFSTPAGPPNEIPVAVNDGYTVNEDGVLTVDSGSGLLDNDSDADGDGLTAQLVSSPSNGSLNINADGSFEYTPDPDFNGTDSFTYQASDGKDVSNIGTVSISVNAINDAPVATADSYSTNMDEAFNASSPGVLQNDTDADGDAMTAELVSGVSNGSLTLNANGSFSYTPNPGFVGQDSFSYRNSDGTLYSDPVTVTIDVTENNTNAMFVNDISFDSRQRGKNSTDYRIVVDIRQDSDGDGVGEANDQALAGVQVTVVFNGKTYSGLTDANGIFRSSWIKNLSPGNYQAEVTGLTHAGFDWNPLLDLEDDSDGDGIPDEWLSI